MNFKPAVFGALLTLALWVPSHAQDKDAALLPPPKSPKVQPSPSDQRAALPHDLLMHLRDMQRYGDEYSLARQRAIEKAEARQARISAAKWFGYSPSRPHVSSVPSMSSYYPIWNTDVRYPTQRYFISTVVEDEVQ